MHLNCYHIFCVKSFISFFPVNTEKRKLKKKLIVISNKCIVENKEKEKENFVLTVKSDLVNWMIEKMANLENNGNNSIIKQQNSMGEL